MIQTRTRDTVAFQVGIVILLAAVLIAILLPLWRVLMTAVTPLDVYSERGVPFFLSPFEWSFEAFRQLLSHPMFPRAMMNSVIITLGGTTLSLVLTVPLAYGLSVSSLPGRKIILLLILFTFLFNPGLIPAYLLVTKLELTNTFWAVVLPPAINVYNTFVMMSFFQNLPEELQDSARIDGANEFQVLWHIVLPLSRPILLTIGLFYAVYYWNEFFNAILYLNDPDLTPLPVLLRNILISASFNEYVEYNAFSSTPLEALKAAGVLLTMLPMLLVYPWIQRYFTRGMLLGGVKE